MMFWKTSCLPLLVWLVFTVSCSAYVPKDPTGLPAYREDVEVVSVMSNAEDVDTAMKGCTFVKGDVLASAPSCVERSTGEVDCFYVDATSHTVKRRTFQGGAPTDAADHGGKNAISVLAEKASVKEDSTVLAILTSDNDLFLNVDPGAAVPIWRALGVTAMELPSLVIHSRSGVVTYYRSSENKIHSVHAAEGVAADWKIETIPESPSLHVPPSCLSTADADGTQECVSTDGKNRLMHLVTNEDDLNDILFNFQDIAIRGRMSFHRSPDGVHLVGWDEHNQLKSAVFDGTSWTEKGSLEGRIFSEPECVPTATTALDCFAIGPDRSIVRTRFDGANWSPWTSSRYGFVDKPSCVRTSETTISCFSRGFSNGLVQVLYEI